MLEFTELTAPASSLGSARRGKQSRVAWVAATSALLLCCALVALSTQDGSRKLSLEEVPEQDIVLPGGGETTDVPGVTNSNDAAPEITTDDLKAEQDEVNAELNGMATEQAGKITGSVPTDEEEADAIIDGSDYVGEMDKAFGDVTGPHSDDADEADAIIDHANKDNMDVTGKAGATLYAAATDPKAPLSAWLRGSIPNYRAESQYILSGVFGNYEKELENGPTMAVVSGKLPARTVAYTIVDEAYKDKTSPDCTGSVDADGIHGVGRGTPPCTALLKFNKPKVDVEAEVAAEQEEGEKEEAAAEEADVDSDEAAGAEAPAAEAAATGEPAAEEPAAE